MGYPAGAGDGGVFLCRRTINYILKYEYTSRHRDPYQEENWGQPKWNKIKKIWNLYHISGSKSFFTVIT